MKSGAWQPLPDFCDEFNGTALDSRRWLDHSPVWQGRRPGLFLPRNAQVAGGWLNLTARNETVPGAPEGYHSFTSASVQSRAAVRYGYFEARARAGASRASSAFWFATQAAPWTWPQAPIPHRVPQGDGGCFEEMDVFEICGKGGDEDNVHYMTVHSIQPGVDGMQTLYQAWTPPYRWSEGFHTFGFEWTKDRLRWFVDGVLKSEQPNLHWHHPEIMIFDTETMDWYGMPDPASLPATFSVDYVRAWAKTDGAPDERTVVEREK